MRPDVLVRDGRSVFPHDLDSVPALDDWLGGNDGTRARLPNDVDLAVLAPRLAALQTLLIDFPAFTDGRGFSVARQLRTQHGFTGELVAHGPLIPDQYAFALQCGFSSVLLPADLYERHTPEAWQACVEAFSATYQRGYTHRPGPDTSVFDARETSALQTGGSEGTDPFRGLSAEAGLARGVEMFGDDICMVSSFGVDSAVLLHMASRIAPDLPIFFLDTQKHFRETLHYRDELVKRLGLTNVLSLTPDPAQVEAIDPSGTLHEIDPDACCALRKVRPLDPAVAPFKARITGRKRFQTPERADMPMFEPASAPDAPPAERPREQAKLNPLAYWSARDVTDYMRRHDLPPHPLLALGYLSIGCQPCTTRVSEGEDPRAGRWRNAPKTECGIHLVDGKWQTTEEDKTYEVF